MAYVDGFNIDLFISYARQDDCPPPGAEKGWVSWFCEHLKFRLERRCGDIEIWRDVREVPGTQLFDPAIEEAVHNSAVFLALTSENYLKSDYCHKELECFHQNASADHIGLTINHQVRIVNVLLNNLDHEEWPDVFSGRTGFVFHDAEEADQFGEPSDPESELFEHQLRELVDALYDLLKAFKRPVAASDEPITGTVFMATAEMPRIQPRIIADLESAGVSVISKIPPPYTIQDHDAKIAEVLKEVDLSVHLLDDLPGRTMEGLPAKTYLQQQAELALAGTQHQLIWIPQTLDIETVKDAPHRAFLQRLEQEDRQAYYFIRSGQSNIVQVVLEQLRQRTVVASEWSCLLDTHKQDEGTAFEIAKKLTDQGVRPLITQEADDPQVVMSLFEHRLRRAKTLIIFFGSVSRAWVKRRIEMAMKIAVMDGWFPDLKLGIFLAPPPKRPDDASFRVGPVVPDVLESMPAILTWLAQNTNP